MKQEDKKLLLQDLCGRIPYGVKMNHIADTENNPITIVGVAKTMITLESPAGYGTSDIEDYIPYLFPLSIMTEKQREEIEDKLIFPNNSDGGWIEILYNDKYNIPFWFIDFCNKNHFDYRGLIEKGLAINATGLNIY